MLLKMVIAHPHDLYKFYSRPVFGNGLSLKTVPYKMRDNVKSPKHSNTCLSEDVINSSTIKKPHQNNADRTSAERRTFANQGFDRPEVFGSSAEQIRIKPSLQEAYTSSQLLKEKSGSGFKIF